jgi:hypothetical protein
MYRARRHKEEKLKKKQEYAKSHYYGLLVDSLYEEAATLLKQNKTNLTE